MLRNVFLVEKNTRPQNSLVVDERKNTKAGAVEIPPRQQRQYEAYKHDPPTPSPLPNERAHSKMGGLVKEYVEVWDYAGGAMFRGFVAEKDEDRALFVFFDKEVIGNDLKPGVVALLELAAAENLDCSQLVVCVDRAAGQEQSEDVVRDLGWVGFELMMLDTWAHKSGCLSDRWLFLGMDV